ncbi:hypothetical protein [Novosphingobium sp. BL-52-GroH]|uniref:hypothetical protein n=1 Tax=Novosphingobium sp. BL-52-GroH TaxID=3349877 RepID=UPI003850988D
MDRDDIIEAMESTAQSRKRTESLKSPFADSADMRLWRDHLLRFLEELDGDITISEVVEALEDYR